MTDVRRRWVRPEVVRLGLVAAVLALALGACGMPGLVALPPSPGESNVFLGRRQPATPDAAKDACAYTYHRTERLAVFSAAVGRDIDCALVYNNASPDWANWERPWFMIHGNPNFNWANWKNAVPGRSLIITQALIPSDAPADWRERGAAGEYEDHARALAANYVAAGLGDSVIRLSHEANGNWTLDGLGYDPAKYGLWKTFWARTARVMDSVPGANFRFDWTINAPYRAIPFDEYYPGDDVVDIIGADVYDFWAGPGPAPRSAPARWRAQYEQVGGLGDLVEYAQQHGKPLSIAEWGISAEGSKGGAGDNPYFVDAIAAVVRNNATAYHSYFDSLTDVNILLTDAPRSLRAYRRHFGTNGDSLG